MRHAGRPGRTGPDDCRPVRRAPWRRLPLRRRAHRPPQPGQEVPAVRHRRPPLAVPAGEGPREAVATGATVYVCEGEKDVHALESIGLVATTSPMGAGKWG